MKEREALENDRAALAVLLRLAETGNTYSIEGEGANLETAIRDAFEDGAGAVEPSAVVAWVKGELARLDNTLDALDGAVGHACRYVCETCGEECPRDMSPDAVAEERSALETCAMVAEGEGFTEEAAKVYALLKGDR